MSIWNSVKQAFGFGGDDDDTDEFTTAAPTYAVTDTGAEPPAAPTEPATQQASDTQPAADAAADADGQQQLSADLFDAVIALFNQTMPDFVSRCISTEKQRQYIYDSLSESLRQRLAAAESAASAAELDRLRTECDNLRHQTDDLTNQAQRVEPLLQEVKKLQLSADRQKRALTDRMRDLEQQLTKANEERERLITRRGAPRTADDDEAHRRVGELTRQLEAEQQETARQTTLREQLEVKVKMTDAMMLELRAKVAEGRKELEDARRQLEDARQQLSVVEEMQLQLSKFEDLKHRKDEKIAELQTALAQSTEQADSRMQTLRDENESLRRTIENNLYNQAHSESRLRNEIKQLRAQLEDASKSSKAEPVETAVPALPLVTEPQPAPAEKPKKRRGRRPKSADTADTAEAPAAAAQSELANIDWLDTPASGAASKRDEPDFGYHEPPRRPLNDDAAQLSLF